jgi:hypothetical protein
MNERSSLHAAPPVIHQHSISNIMSLSIFEFGDGRYRLYDGEREIGWVEGRAVGFVGFDTEESALRAATVGYDALIGWLGRQSRDAPAPRGRRRLVVRAGAAERLLTLGGVAVGGLVSGSEHHGATDGTFGFELTLPPRIGAALSAAQVIHHALSGHRPTREVAVAESEGSAEAVV